MKLLHLGVLDIPEPQGNTTFGVGKILEDKYGLFSAFVENNDQFIADAIADDAAASLETFLLSGQLPDEMLPEASGKISQRMKEFLSLQEVEKLGLPGVPTKAALQGRSIRFKQKRGPRRPSFIDSGVLEASLKAWID
jgi:hypothetical protein